MQQQQQTNNTHILPIFYVVHNLITTRLFDLQKAICKNKYIKSTGMIISSLFDYHKNERISIFYCDQTATFWLYYTLRVVKVYHPKSHPTC